MSIFDDVYKKLVIDVLQNGIWDKDQDVRTVWEDGTPAYTKSMICKQKIKIENSEGELHLIVSARSNDIGLGHPLNVFQYYVLQRMIAQVTGYDLGTLTFNINDAHIYERHIELLKEQIQGEAFLTPELRINPDVKNFDDFTIDNFELVNYQYHPSIKMEIAI